MKHLGIFCSASDSIHQVYFEATDELGRWMGRERKTLVYGGSNIGLMECVARAVKESGGHVIGVIPSKLEKNGRESSIPHEIIRTQNLSDRKDILIEKSDVLIALPGGMGTLDEIFHVISSASMGYHHKKVILYNVEGFYNELLQLLHVLAEKKFARLKLSDYYTVADTLEELIGIIEKL